LNKKSKFLIYSSSCAQWGGGHIYIENLCKYIKQSGYNVKMLTSIPSQFRCKTDKLKLSCRKIGRFLESFYVAYKYKKSNYKIIILNDLESIWLAPIFYIFGYKVYSLLHLYLMLGDGNGVGHKRWQYSLILFSSKWVNKIFSVNKDNIDVFGEKRTIFVGNYLSSWFFEKDVYPKKEYDFLLIARFSKNQLER